MAGRTRSCQGKLRRVQRAPYSLGLCECYIFFIICSLAAPYPTHVYRPAYQVIDGTPTICGGDDGGSLDTCLGYTPAGTWEELLTLPQNRFDMGFVALNANTMMMTGSEDTCRQP